MNVLAEARLEKLSRELLERARLSARKRGEDLWRIMQDNKSTISPRLRDLMQRDLHILGQQEGLFDVGQRKRYRIGRRKLGDRVVSLRDYRIRAKVKGAKDLQGLEDIAAPKYWLSTIRQMKGSVPPYMPRQMARMSRTFRQIKEWADQDKDKD